MSGVLKHRRGNTAFIKGITWNGGEIALNLDDGSVVVGDGGTAGGLTIGGREVVSIGTTYNATVADQGHLLLSSNAGATAVSLPQAVTANNFGNGQGLCVLVLGAGTVTITPTTSTINGAATLALTTGQGAFIWSSGSNYFAIIGFSSAASKLITTVTKTTSYGVTTGDSATHFNNIAAGGSVTFTLPAAAAGLNYGFYVDAAHPVVITAAGSDVIQATGLASSAGGSFTSASRYSYLEIVSHSTGRWAVPSMVGAWTPS